MRRSSRRVLPALSLGTAALLTTAAGCASSGSAPIESAAATNQSTIRVDGGASTAFQTQITHADQAAEIDLPVPADRTFAVLPTVYEQIGLKINTAVSDARTLGVSGTRTRRVGKDQMSRFLACGRDATGAPLADTYSVMLTVLSRVTASGTTGSVLSTQVLGTAQPISTSGAPVTCESTGVLEDRIAKATALRIAG